MKKTIFYPIFIKCVSFIHDPFWRFIYEDLAYGKCPYGMYLQKNYLCCSLKNKEFSYKIENNKSCQEIYEETFKLMKFRVGLLSEKEKLIQKEKALRTRVVLLKDDWSNIKKKMIRDTLLENFVLSKKMKFDLSMNVSKKVLSNLIIGLMFKTLNSKDIVYSNGFIQDIHGFHFQPKKVIISKNIYQNKNIKLYEEETPTIKYMYSYWNIFINDCLFLSK